MQLTFYWTTKYKYATNQNIFLYNLECGFTTQANVVLCNIPFLLLDLLYIW